MRRSSQIEGKLPKSKLKQQKIVYRISNNTSMKFKPQRNVFDAPSGFIDRIKSLSKIFSRESVSSNLSPPPFRQSTQLEINKKSTIHKQILKYLFKLDGETFLIGNTKQLDAITISTVQEYIETEQLWSLSLKSPFLNVIIEEKRKLVIAIIKGQLVIYSFEGKKSKKAPQLLKSFRIFEGVKEMQVVKDKLIVFFQSFISSYNIDRSNLRQCFKRQLKINKNLALYQLGQCIQDTISVFFEAKKDQTFFQLWCLNVEIIQQKLVIGKINKIYEVDNQYKSSLKIESITKDAFLMNLGQSVLMFSKGYFVDKFFINLKVDGTFLKYFNHNLIHISQNQIDFYSVTIDLVSNPPKLIIRPFDSIINIDTQKYQFFDAIKFQQHQMAFFYYLPFVNNSGEIKYLFNLTQKWNYQQKIEHILPKISTYKGKYEGKQFEELLSKIQISCDSVRKMGMSRKDVYLRIWRESKKQNLQQFKFLLDTLDYHTIKQQIMHKLRKKSMGFLEVIKMQYGCLGMIQQNLFGKLFSIDQFKNYVTSHFLIRKLQLFKEIKLHQKSTGKAKLYASQKRDERLLINIQQYTNVIKMDIKSYLLDLIYNYAKYRKDLITEIRIVIRKFKFTFLFIYQSLLKQIVNIVKQDLLFLLQNIPQILPYSYSILSKGEQIGLRDGMWGDFKQQEWDNALFFDNVVTVYNKQAILEFAGSIWIKRNWLTHHNMIFLGKNSIEQVFKKAKAESLFYALIEHIYHSYEDESLIKDLTRFLQENYTLFPHHLFNCVQLYRQLFLYFKQRQVMNESFESFLKKSDEQVFKKIFQHQKFQKGSFLQHIKPIYSRLNHSDKFNRCLLKYFSSNLSQVSDIKYLLNRINKLKEQQHIFNEQMYQVLVKGMQIKLKLGSDNDIPMEQVLIYIEKIPVSQKNPLSQQIRILQKINEYGSKFKEMKLNMNVFEMIRNRDIVLFKAVSYYIQKQEVKKMQKASQIVQKSTGIIKFLSGVRSKIYGSFQDYTILFIYMVKLMEKQHLVPTIPQIISSFINEQCQTERTVLLQNAVFYCYRQQMIQEPLYHRSANYIKSIISLLSQQNNLRIFIGSQLQLAHMFSSHQIKIRFPICGENGFVTIYQLQQLFFHSQKGKLLQIDVKRVFQLSRKMQQIQDLQQQHLVNLYDIYEIYFVALLQKNALREAISVIQQMIELQPNSPYNIVYPLTIFKRIGSQFIQQNKWLMFSLINKIFDQPRSLTKVFYHLLFKSFSNQDKKELLLQNVKNKHERNNLKDNILLVDQMAQFLQQTPQRQQQVKQLLYKQLMHLFQSQYQFCKSIDILNFYILLVQQPILLAKYIHINRFAINFKEFKSFISYLCKYSIFDRTKIIQLAKRIFKVIYDVENHQGQFRNLIEEIKTPLRQCLMIDKLEVSSPNSAKLSQSIERFKSKIKFLSNPRSVIKKKTQYVQSGSQKHKKIHQYLQDSSKYFTQTEQYPFNDSDGHVRREEFLFLPTQKSTRIFLFSCEKYLHWLLGRTNQKIQTFLIKANEDDADKGMKQKQQALKLSFRKNINDRGIKENANLFRKAFSKITKEKVQKQIVFHEQTTPISSIPLVPSSAISIHHLWTEQPQETQEVYLGSTLLKDEIIKSLQLEQQQITFDHNILHKFGTPSQIQSVIPILLREIYTDQNVEYWTSLQILKSIYSLYPKFTPINLNCLEIYTKIDQLQRKLALDLPVREVLSYQWLLIMDKDSSNLFALIKNAILQFINENNIHTLSRIVSLAFKKPEFQQEIINQYFKISVEEYDKLENEFDQNMKLQKIIAFAQKMPINHLKSEIEKIVDSMQNKYKKNSIIAAMSDILRGRNDFKSAESLIKKTS